MLFYTPETEVFSISPPGEDFEIALLRFHRSFLKQYFDDGKANWWPSQQGLIYEDLDFQSERLLRSLLKKSDQKIRAHAHLLELLALFFEKLKRRQQSDSFERLHPNDIKALFLAAAQLRLSLIHISEPTRPY